MNDEYESDYKARSATHAEASAMGVRAALEELARGDKADAIDDATDDTRAEIKNAYARGYAAGRKRVIRDEDVERRWRRERRFAQQVFCAALQGLIVEGGWTMDGKPLGNSADYIKLAWRFAEDSLKQRRGEIV